MENTFSIEEEDELPVLTKEQLIAEILESTQQAKEGKDHFGRVINARIVCRYSN